MNAPVANLTHWAERVDMAAAFRWTARLNMHEAVANHFSLAVNGDGSRFLINPNGRHFSRITASSLVEIDANDAQTMQRPDAPDPTAWGLHGSIHRALPHARCVCHVHSIHATVLASLADSRLPAIDQNTAMFFGRHVVDDHYGGMAFEEEGARCAEMLADPKVTTMVMGNHGVLVTAPNIGEAFDDIWTLERACQILITAWSTGQPLKVLSDAVAEKTAQDWEKIADFSRQHFAEMKQLMIDLDPSLVD